MWEHHAASSVHERAARAAANQKHLKLTSASTPLSRDLEYSSALKPHFLGQQYEHTIVDYAACHAVKSTERFN